MLAAILFLITIVLFGTLAGIFTRSIVIRGIVTAIFGMCWLLVVGEVNDSGDATVLWGVWGIGMGLFLLGLWITSQIQRSMTLDELAEATAAELHEGLLTLIDVHGEGGSEWLQHEWLASPYEAQRGWVRQHRTAIKQELASAASAGGFDPTDFWTRMETLENYRP